MLDFPIWHGAKSFFYLSLQLSFALRVAALSRLKCPCGAFRVESRLKPDGKLEQDTPNANAVLHALRTAKPPLVVHNGLPPGSGSQQAQAAKWRVCGIIME